MKLFGNELLMLYFSPRILLHIHDMVSCFLTLTAEIVLLIKRNSGRVEMAILQTTLLMYTKQRIYISTQRSCTVLSLLER